MLFDYLRLGFLRYMTGNHFNGEEIRGHYELLAASGEVCLNSTPSTRAFSCAASLPSSYVQTAMHHETNFQGCSGWDVMCLISFDASVLIEVDYRVFI